MLVDNKFSSRLQIFQTEIKGAVRSRGGEFDPGPVPYFHGD